MAYTHRSDYYFLLLRLNYPKVLGETHNFPKEIHEKTKK